MTTLFGVLALLGRLMIAAIFLLSAVGQKIPKFSDTAAYMASEGVPMPKIMLGGAIVFLIAGSLSVAAGFKAVQVHGWIGSLGVTRNDWPKQTQTACQ